MTSCVLKIATLPVREKDNNVVIAPIVVNIPDQLTFSLAEFPWPYKSVEGFRINIRTIKGCGKLWINRLWDKILVFASGRYASHLDT